MGLLELYNQITNGILPSGDDKKHIDNMPLGNPQWENKNDTTTDYGNTDQITGTPTPNQYPAGPIESYTQTYDKDNTYLDQIYTNTNNDAESPLSESLDSSQLDNQNNPNPDPTEYPVEANSLVAQNSGNKNYSQDNGRNNKYNTTISDSPLLDSLSTSSLDDSVVYNTDNLTYTPDELIGTPNFTPKYTSEDGEEYDDNVNRDDTDNSPLYNSLDSSSLDDKTSPVYTDPGSTTPTNVSGTFNFTPSYNEVEDYDDKVNRTSTSNSPLTDRLDDSDEYAPDEIAGPFDFEPKYTSEEKYDTTISDSPLLDSLDSSSLDERVIYNTPQTYPPDELIGTPDFTPEYNSDREYDDNVDRNNINNSPLVNSLDSSSLDNMDDYKSDEDDPTIYPIEANSSISSFTGNKNFQQKYYNEEDKEYSDKVNRDENENSPLNLSLLISQLDNGVNYKGPGTTTPDGISGSFNFSPLYNKNNEYDDNVGLIDGEYVSNISNSFEGTPILDEDNTTQYPNNNNVNFGGTQVKGINPITGKPITEYNQKYNSNSTYYDYLEEEEIETR